MVVSDPPLMLYDEPLTGLDPIACGVIVNLIRRLNDALGMTSLVSPNARGAEIADQVLIVANRGIVFAGTPAELDGSADRCASSWTAPDGPIVRLPCDQGGGACVT